MAIQLTPKQQKASFGAFDSTSQFESGLEGVSRAAGQMAQTVQNYSTSMQEKRKKAQRALAREADASRAEALAQAKGAYGLALDTGDQQSIEAAYKEVERVITTPLTKYVPSDLGGTLDDSEAISQYDAPFRKSTADYIVALDAEKNQRVLVNQADSQLKEFNKTLVTAVNNSGGAGLSMGALTKILSGEFITDEQKNYIEVASGLTQEGSDAFFKLTKDLILNFAVVDLEDTLDPKLLKEKKAVYNEFISNNPQLNWEVADVDKIDDQFKKSLEDATDPTLLKDHVTKQLSDNIPSLEVFVSTTTKNPSEALGNYVTALEQYEYAKTVLDADDATLERFGAVVGLLKLFAPETQTDSDGNITVVRDQPTAAQTMLQEMLDSATPETFTNIDILKEHADVKGNNLDSSAISKLKDWLANQRTGMQNEIKRQDASFIRRLSPVYDALYKAAQAGDTAARAQLEFLYSRYAKENKKAFGFTIPTTLHIPLVEKLPDTLDQTALLKRVGDETAQNSLESSSEYAASQVNNGVSSVNEQAYYQLLWAASNTQLTGGDPKLVERGAELLDLSERAEKSDTELLNKILNENDSFLSTTYNTTKLVADKNYSAALSKFILGIIVDSEATEYDDVVKQVKQIEREVLIPLFGYTTQTDSSSSITVPNSVMAKYGDFDQIPYFKGMFARLGASYNNLISPDKVSDIYANAVYGLIAKKYDINTARDLQRIIDLRVSDVPVGDVGFTYDDVQFTDVQGPEYGAYKALARGMKENTRKVGVEERPVGRISNPVWVRNSQGRLEQRIYLETTSGNRSVKKTTTEEGDVMYITLSEVDVVVGETVARYTNPLDQIMGTEEMYSSGLTQKGSRLNTVFEVIEEQSRMDVLKPLELNSEN